MLDEWLPGWRVSSLKVDAQGHDLGILTAAGASRLRRIDEISMEVLHDDCDGLYEGQPNCTAVMRQMDHLGFLPRGDFRCAEKRHFTQGSGCEANVLLDGKERRPPIVSIMAREERVGHGRAHGHAGRSRGRERGRS